LSTASVAEPSSGLALDMDKPGPTGASFKEFSLNIDDVAQE